MGMCDDVAYFRFKIIAEDGIELEFGWLIMICLLQYENR
jgi:hypothetical protein